MKKILTIALSILLFSGVASAQPRAVGLRFNGGWSNEVSYQHQFGNNFLEATVGLWYSNSCQITGTYNFIIASPQWTEGEWNVYGGPGAVFGFGSEVNIGIAGQIGLEYTFNIPLQLSIDIRPQYNFTGASGFFAFYPCLGVRYRF